MRANRTRNVLIAITGGSLAALVFGFVLFAAIATRSADGPAVRSDGIVVLTGGDARIAEAARLLRTGSANRLLISGVNRKTSREDLLKLTGLDDQLFDCCVDVGYEALDTYGNADEARAWVNRWGFSSLIVVTATYHMPRSLAEIGLALPHVKLIPRAVVPRKLQGAPWWLHVKATRTLIAEYFRFLPVATRLAAARILNAGEVPSSGGAQVSGVASGRL